MAAGVSQTFLLDCFTKFKEEPSPSTKAELAGKICHQYNIGGFALQEKEIVNEILDYLSRDIEVMVRKTISEILKESEVIPHDIAVRFALDIEEVSVPILEFSPVLTDDDLKEIIRSSRAVGKSVAIAKRKSISSTISDKLIRSANDNVVVALFNNKGAEINDNSLSTALDLFQESESVLASLIRRGGLNSDIVQKIAGVVSESVKKNLIDQYGVDVNAITAVVEQADEKIITDVLSQNVDNVGKTELISNLYHIKKLTPSLILRSLCRGDIEFFEMGMAKLADIPINNARRLLQKGNSAGFSALYNAASMPDSIRRAAEIVFRFVAELKNEYRENDSELSSLLIQKIVNLGYDHEIPNMRYFLALISSSPVEQKY